MADPTSRKDREYVEPGSVRAQEIEQQSQQQHAGKDFMDGLASTAGAAGIRVLQDEAAPLIDEVWGDIETPNDPLGWVTDRINRAGTGALTLAGARAGKADYNKDEKFEELTDGIPFEYWDDIMDNDNLDAAFRARARVKGDLERQNRIASQYSGGLASLAGSLVDVDLPLTFMSGGAFGAAKVSQTAYRAARLNRLSPRAAQRIQGVAEYGNAGLQAGVAVGAADAAWRETTGWEDVAHMALLSTMMGAGIGSAVKPQIKATYDDFINKVATDDPSLRATVDVERAAKANEALEFMPDQTRIEEGSIGAAQVTPGLGRPQRNLVDPYGPISPEKQSIIDEADRVIHDSGWRDRKTDADDEWWSKVALSGIGSFTVNNYNSLYRSKSAVANYMAGWVFESPHGLGRGRATAATRMENYHKRVARHLGSDLDSARNEWAKRHGQTWGGSGYHISDEGHRAFNRQVMLELNDRAMGRTSQADPDIKRAADQYELAGQEALGIGRGRDGEKPVDGFENVPDRRGYTPYKWNGSKITQLIKDGTVTRQAIVQAVADGYRQAGLGAGKDADLVAEAVIHRAMHKDADMDASVLSLLTGDGHEFLRETLKINGTPDAQIDTILDRLKGAQHDKSKESFAKMRNEVDMAAQITTRNGQDLRVVDLLDTNMVGVWQRYARQMSGSAALARVGITNRAKRKEFIEAMRAEQRALGEEPMDAAQAEAMFSHFNAGPVHGYHGGHTNEGVGNLLATAKRITNLALLEKLGMSQLAEEGASIAQNGLATWWRRGIAAKFDQELKSRNKELLNDMAYFTGEIGQDQHMFRQHLDLDDTTDLEKGHWAHTVQKWTQNAQYIQSYTSLFNQIRSHQQTTAALGVADKVFREVKRAVDAGTDIDPKMKARFEADLGLMPEDIMELERLVHQGVIEFGTRGNQTFVNRLNMDQWDAEIGEVFASSITRNINQLVQKSMAGEQDAWMHTQWGSILTHLKTFPLQAVSKQLIRNMRHMDVQAQSTLLYGMATAMVAVSLRDAIDGRERDIADRAKAAFGYSNMTGFVPMYADPFMSVLGMDDHRFNHYGPHFDWTPPMVSVLLNDMTRLGGAAVNTLTGEADYYDAKALRALPFAGTYFLSRAFD